MRLLVLSDLHLDIWRGHHPKYDLRSKPDVVVLAGDIHSGARGVQWAAETFPDVPVLYVAGNHEAYGYDVQITTAAIHAACTMFENVIYLEDDQCIIGDVRFLGSTLWTDFCLFGKEKHDEALYASKLSMNDYRAIEFQGRKLLPEDTKRFHVEQRAWLKRFLDAPFDGKTVVITHMAPSIQSVPVRYRGELASAAFASNLDGLVAKADLWIHGHTHDSFDYHIEKCRVVCNPCGYPCQKEPENDNFHPDLIVEI